MLICLFFMAVVFDFMNGMRDASNFVSTMISTRALPVRLALWLTAAAEFCGPFIIGTRVANAYSHDLVSVQQIGLNNLLAALASAVIWNIITLRLAIPSSSTHALFGGIVGAVFVGPGLGVIYQSGMIKILISLLLSPILGLLVGFLVTRLIYFLARFSSPIINKYFRQAQVVTGITLAFSYGGNDAQKSMGILSMALLISSTTKAPVVPAYVMALSAGATALGIAIGGLSLIRTLGNKFYKVRPVHGFSSQVSSVVIVLLSAVIGAPVSTSQVVTTTILGAGSAERVKMVRWGAAGSVVRAWLLTIPVCALMGMAVGLILR
jgi:inorganic phosphate transporter, PiT family